MTDTDKNCPHCGVHIDDHPASPCLNAWVAEDVMGWIRKAFTSTSLPHFYWSDGKKMVASWTWDPSGNIAVAWEVVEKLKEEEYWFSLVYKSAVFKGDLNKDGWLALFRCVRGGTREDHFGVSILHSHAICRAAIKGMPKSQDRIDPDPRLEEIAKAAAEISTMSSEEAFEAIVKGISKVPEQLQAIIDSVVAIQFDWPMPEEGWKRFVEDVERTNERLGLDLHVNPPDHFGSLEEIEMPKTTFITAYTVDTIRLIRATLRGTTELLVPFKVDPLEFCREAHKIKDELVSRAMELLENTIDARFNNWISVEERMPTEDALYLIHAPSLDPDKPFIKTAWFDPDIVLGWQFIPKVWSDAVTHWMPLPKPPSEIKGEE